MAMRPDIRRRHDALRAFAADLLANREQRTNGIICVGMGMLGCLFLYLAQFHMALTEQYVVGWGSVLLLLICKKMERFKRPPLRFLFILLATFVSIRYLIWRTTETIIYERLSDFTATIVIYAAEVYVITLHLLGAFVNIWPQETKIMPLPDDPSQYPTVDVFIPTYNEPLSIVKTTATAALNIDYPKDRLTIHILDDGATVAKRNDPRTALAAWERHYTFRRTAAALGVRYITRERNVKAKAGNLNHALGHTGSDLVLILDCDHVPTKDILKNTAGWFVRNPNLAWIQTPHFFINPSPLEKNVEGLREAPLEGELFYRGAHLGLDCWNSSYFCGSAGIIRRKHLEEVDGFSGETITEDCETSYALHQKGYHSLYIARPMVCGLSPETFDDFGLQRSRWAQGMTQIMVLKNLLFAQGLKFYQRLCYFNMCMYWFFSISRVIFFVAPVAFLFLKLHVYYASVPEVIAYAAPHFLGSIFLIDFLHGRYRWPFQSELYEGVQSLFLLPAVLSALVNPRKPSFLVTPKGRQVESNLLSGLTLPFFIMCSMLLIAIPTAIAEWWRNPLYRDTTLIVLIWCLYNVVLAMAAFGALLDRKQMRRHHRMWTKGMVTVFFPRLKTTVEANVQDISLSGMGLSLNLPFPLKPREHVILEARDSSGEKYSLEARILRSAHKQKEGILFCGAEFILADETQRSTAIQFVYGDSQRWVDYWNRRTKALNPLTMLWLTIKMTRRGFTTSLIAFRQVLYVSAVNAIKRAIRRAAAPTSANSAGH